MTLLSASNLSASLGGRQVLFDVSFELAAGEFVGLIGPNGAGKSTLLRALMGMIPCLGETTFDELGAVGRARKAAYVAQSRDIAWPMAVEAVVALGRTPHLGAFAPLGRADREAVEEAMRRMDVTEFRDRPATELSGGELARVLVARALAQETPLLLADEPPPGLDPAHQISLMRLFSGLAAQGRGVVASTHDLGLAARYCSRLLLLDKGRLVADGPPERVLTPKNLRAVYGVDAFFAEAGGRMVVTPVDLAEG